MIHRMPSPSFDARDAIEHLPVGATLVVADVEWTAYEDLVDGLDRAGLRISYDDGTLEIMSPSAEHEEYKEIISDLVRAFSDETGIPLEKRGSATWKRRLLRKGVEPDACFYVANADRIAGLRQIDLERDPAPDIVVEIEITKGSLSKFEIYAALRVVELWRYDGRRVSMYRLDGDRYVTADASAFLHGLTVALLEEFLDLAKTETQTRLLQLFRQRVRTL